MKLHLACSLRPMLEETGNKLSVVPSLCSLTFAAGADKIEHKKGTF